MENFHTFLPFLAVVILHLYFVNGQTAYPRGCPEWQYPPRTFGLEGRFAQVDEFPWVVRLEYRTDKNETKTECVGTLINERHVLTAAHCVTGDVLYRYGKLASVRLEQNYLRERVPCVGRYCSPQLYTADVEKVSIPRNYNPSSRAYRQGDIALIRLKESVPLTPLGSPVRLPFETDVPEIRVGEKLVTVGLGKTINERQIDTKQALDLIAIDHEECRKKYATKHAFIDTTQLCAGSEYARNDCDGDTGAPLMRFYRNSWVIEGVGSFGNGCALDGLSGVYTKVSAYENWIKGEISTR